MADTLVSHDRLRAVCNPSDFTFETTADLAALKGPVGQDIAVEAIRLSAEMRHPRFNLFVYGPEGSGRHSTVLRILQDVAATRPEPDDWVYVNNFADPDKPLAIRLPPGEGPRLRDAVAALVEDLASRIPAVLVSEDCQTRRAAIEQEFAARHEAAFNALVESARKRNVAIMRTPMGFSLAPMHAGEVLKAEAMAAMPEADRARIEADVQAIHEELEDFLASLPELGREQREAMADLNARMAESAVKSAMSRMNRSYARLPEVQSFFQALRQDFVVNADLFLSWERSGAEAPFPRGPAALHDDPRFHRYAVNVVTTHEKGAGAPVIVETMPTLANLSGRIDYMSQQGTLVTDFTLIKPGALHRANGGFLLLDARRVLSEPFAWDALKRSLETHEIRITTAADRLGLIATTTMEPQAIPLDVRVVLVGDQQLLLLLSELDPDYGQFFRVAAEFADDMTRDAGSMELFARMLATVGAQEGLRPVARDGVAALIEASSRAAEDQQKICLRTGEVLDLMREADHLAGRDGVGAITGAHVAAVIASRERRLGRTRDRLLEMVSGERILISTTGSVVGQVNGLTVADIGELRFGMPVRITARVRMGSGRVVDIEREAKLGGPIHSKAVLILSGFLAARYAPDVPLSLWASLVLEQSYGRIEGDSASLAELCALMSALADVPISQSYAVTGSVNQLGDVQPVGGINEKIEGFFRVCAEKGLTGRQGVVIPRGNLGNLMLRDEVVNAVASGRFQIHAVSHVDEAISQLTGLPAGRRTMNGEFESGSINANIEVRLLDFAEARAGQGDLSAEQGAADG
ncbi:MULTISPECIES: Lon protease family protein [Tabrizicola]|uniref:Lon protease family protein n=1 Tax=Tabrizicola TaxID=1443919 RepID=UPI00107FF520|nr:MULTISPECIES: ATP-binding protein [Paracoccaceae]